MDFGAMHDNHVTVLKDEREHNTTSSDSVLKSALLLSAEAHNGRRSKGQSRHSWSQLFLTIIVVLEITCKLGFLGKGECTNADLRTLEIAKHELFIEINELIRH
jgi:hypothetical protein